MVAKRHHDYQYVINECIKLIEQGEKPEWIALSQKLNVPASTLQNILRAAGLGTPRDIKAGMRYTSDGQAIKLMNEMEDGEKLEKTEDGNATEYISVSVKGQIKSVDDLIKACKIDLNKYVITDSEHRKWDVSLKVRQEDGTDQVMIVPQFYVRLKTFPRHPEPIMPMISPIQITMEPAQRATEPRKSLKRAMIVPDVHIGFRRRLHTQELTPFHDRRVLDLVMQILEGGWFDDVIFIGDCLDFSEFSTKFTAEPEFYYTTQPALIEWAWWLASFRQIAPGAKLIQFEGNHDKRLESMTVAYMRAAYGLRPVDELEMPPSLSTERLLALHELKVDYIKGYPDNVRWINKNVMVRHGDVVRAGAGDSAKAVINKTTYTTIFGHIHRREYVSRRIKSRDGDIIQHAICPGCACQIDGRVPGSTSEQQWQQGLAVVEYTDAIENIIPISVDEGVAIYDGKIYKARTRDKEINSMLMKKLEKIKS
jgi:metallophosphoesterase superfamily enzyme